MHASACTADALAAAAADGERVCLSNLVVRHRKRRGSKLFFARASAEAGWDVQLSFMTRRGEAHDDADTSARLSPEAHAAAYEGCAPGATIAKVWGALERVRAAASAETEAPSGRGDRRDDANVQSRECSSRGETPSRDFVAFETPRRALRPAARDGTVATLRVDRVAFAPPAGGAAAPDCWLVFDMAYDGWMTEGERGALSRQVTMCVAANGRARIPFRLAVVGDDAPNAPNAPNAPARRGGGDGGDDRAAFRVSATATGPSAEPSGTGAGATGEGNRVDPEALARSSDACGSSDGPQTRPRVDWRALPWRAWSAQRFSSKTFFAASFHAPRAGARGPPAGTERAKRSARVVYLSADADDVLETVEPGDVFVLGGVVDHAPKPELARRRFESLREAFFGENADDAKTELDDAEAGVAFVTLRLPLAGHVALAKNAHLPCLAVAQTLMVFRQTQSDRSTGRNRIAETGGVAPSARAGEWPAKEGGANASAWGETLARCPAFRCAPLRKYVRWAPPYETLNEKEGEVKPSRVTDVTALMRDARLG